MTNSLSKMNKFQRFVFRILSIINRFAHFLDIAVFYLLADWLSPTLSNDIMKFAIYAIPIVQLVRAVKWEWRIQQSKVLIRDMCQNGRVMGFTGAQGRGKTSFMLYCLAVLKRPVYSNFPCKIRNQFVHVLEKDILNLQTKIPDGSVTVIDEATLLYHNLMIDTAKLSTEHKSLFAQEVTQQLVRHFFDGNMFYSSVDITRLPQFMRENVGLTNLMLGQGNVRLSYFTGLVCTILGRFCGLIIDGSVRYWDVQQLERIPEKGYVFDLSNQDKDTDATKFANLIRFCGFNTAALFEYDDRFMRGVYAELPDHIDTFWQSLDFSPELLRRIGYGKILDFFDDQRKASVSSFSIDLKK